MTTRTWSPSAVILARSCPLAWWLRYGDPTPRRELRWPAEDGPRAHGIVAHAGFAAAYRAARNDEDYTAGTTMGRYTDTAMTAMAVAWEGAGLPRHSAHRVAVLTDVEAVLVALPCPHPAAVLAVEERLPMTAPSGTPYVVVPDLVLRTGPASVHIRDWKRRAASGLPKAGELADDDQLTPYTLAAAQRWPWAHTVSVGLFSVTSRREVVLDPLPLDVASERVRGQEVTAYEMEHALAVGGKFEATPDGSNCTGCAGRSRCPVWNPPDTRRDYRLVG